MEIKNRIEKLRARMKETGLDAYIIPSSDSHMSEYVAARWKGRSGSQALLAPLVL